MTYRWHRQEFYCGRCGVKEADLWGNEDEIRQEMFILLYNMVLVWVFTSDTAEKSENIFVDCVFSEWMREVFCVCTFETCTYTYTSAFCTMNGQNVWSFDAQCSLFKSKSHHFTKHHWKLCLTFYPILSTKQNSCVITGRSINFPSSSAFPILLYHWHLKSFGCEFLQNTLRVDDIQRRFFNKMKEVSC